VKKKGHGRKGERRGEGTTGGREGIEEIKENRKMGHWFSDERKIRGAKKLKTSRQ